MEHEKLSFKLELSGTYWNKKPHFTVAIDDTTYHTGSITAASDESEFVEFDAELAEGQHELKITLLGKTPTDTVKDSDDPENFNIVKDLLLNVLNISVDDIDLDMLRYSESVYKLAKPHDYQGTAVTELKDCVNLGFNGTYVLKFSTPFYLWLLEKL